MGFAELLTAWMARQRFNNADAAAAFGVSESTIGRWLKGRGLPDIKRVDQLAEIMDAPSGEIALAIVAATSKGDPIQRLEQLLEAVLARMDGIEARQSELEARSGATGRSPRRGG